MNNFQIDNCSMCFSMPFEIEIGESKILDEFYEQNKSINKKDSKKTGIEKREECSDLKDAFLKCNIKKLFPDAEVTIPCTYNKRMKYKSRFACKCLSLASKYLDDDDSSNAIVQFFLGDDKVEYKTNRVINEEMSEPKQHAEFIIRKLLYLKQIDDKYYQAHLLLIVNNDNVSIDDIIFIKHLFYKKKLKCSFSGFDESMSIIDWANAMQNSVYITLHPHIEDVENIKNVQTICFSNSFIEINVKQDFLYPNKIETFI